MEIMPDKRMKNLRWVEDKWPTVSKAIGESQYLNSPGPLVIGYVGEKAFALNGCLAMQGPRQVLIATEDRERLEKALLTKRKRSGLRRWSAKDYRTFDGFYIPWYWLDRIVIEGGKNA